MTDTHTHPAHTTKRLIIAMVLNAMIFGIELAGGLLTNSLALVSDAMHNLSDFFALILSYVATRVASWKSNSQKSYGYARVEIFIAFINALTLVGIGGYIIYKGINRLLHPEPVLAPLMIAIASIGFIANASSVLLLRKDADRNLNLKSAYLHLFTDAVSSFAVVVVGLLISWRQWYLLDPIISVGIGVFIIKTAWTVLIEAVNILTEGTPKGLDLEEVAQFIRSFPEVENIHHIHIWNLSSQFRALSAHLVVKDRLISEGCVVTKRLEEALHERFKIDHPTFQLESEVCADQDTIVDLHHPRRKE